MTLTLTFTTSIDGVTKVLTYDRQYPSLAKFIADYAESYNHNYGADHWSVIEKLENQ